MATATIKLVNSELLGAFFVSKGRKELAAKLLKEGYYKVQGTMGIPEYSGEDVAEYVFDITNNPARIQDRKELYGDFRSVSVGDIVCVDGIDYLCDSVGWVEM